MYSAYQNRFYKTKYGKNFNYDFSVKNSFKINGNEEYVLPNKKDIYALKQSNRIENKKVGYNIFELQAQKIDSKYKYYDFNFGIYNWQEITKDGINPDKQWWEYKPESCSWYNVACHIKNGVVWIINNIPGVKQTTELASGIGKILYVTKELFTGIFEMWKFSPMLYNTIINIFILIIFMKVTRLL
ncbi:spiroplasma phage ORF1-like family protein [Spiroplasma endosymbiont of Tipula paludosa]|uniref:spiroplasma phage ORF1-like family protein n=1 Tax=Spiroplasma endosymbiont of Tipula paludosa TaxID=3066295 RepID=UPI0035C92119